MKEFTNLAIMASAGTGKTYSLAMRYITLLKLGVEPEEIVAMTFTNKAAGEIFDKIIQEILGMIASPDKLRSTVEAGNLPEDTTRESLFAILRKILCAPKKLQISTLDSFFFNIISAFPFECGIAGEITMLPESDDEQRVKALLQLIRGSDDKQRKILLELIKLSSLNTEPYSIFAPAQKLIEKSYGEYLKYPAEELWNNEPFLDREADASDLLSDEELLRYRQLFLAKAENTEKRLSQYYSKLADFAGFAIQYARTPVDFESRFDNPVKTFFENDPDWLNAASVETKYYTTITLEGRELEALQKIVRHLLAVEYRTITNRTHANYDLLRRFDDTYADAVRRNGGLTFKDIPFLLKPRDNAGSLALPFSDNAVLEERLDAKYNHYLLDEFQDTSDEQWRAIANLVDEIFQPDQDRFRSFFYVGDIKQSIYQWRDGNPELFEAVFRRYSDPGFDSSRLQKATLTRSFRSSVPVIETVNRVFLHPEKIPGVKVAEAVRKMEFEEHSSAPSAAKQAGYAALIECSEHGSKEVSAESVFELLLSLDPFSERHDYSVGILTLGNEFAASMAERFRDFCRERNLESAFAITVEGVMLLNDSMLFAVYRNLLTLALHPGDPMARGFLSMVALPEEHLTLRDLPLLHGDREKETDSDLWFRKISRHIRASTAANGFTQYARRFQRIFQSRLADFDAKRMDLTLDAAMKFDATGNKNIADYLHYLDCIESKSSSVRKTVQFMTIHKSKGLDFDIVILPDLYTQTGIDVCVSRGELLVKKDAEFQPQWVTYPPKSALTPYFHDIAAVREEDSDAKTYERCCQLYVAMTRARHALYLMTAAPEGKEKRSAIRFGDLLKSTLAESDAPIPPEDEAWIAQINERLRKSGENAPQLALLYSCGDVAWADRKNVKEDSTPSFIRKANRNFRTLIESFFSAPQEVMPEKRTLLRNPSEHTKNTDTFHPVFREGPGGIELGLHLHALFQRIGFLDETNTERILLDYLEEIGEEAAPELQETIAYIFRHAVSTADAVELLSRPQGTTAELWRERKFCIRNGSELVSCVFDRVVIERNPAGGVERLTLIDYKSDNSDDPDYFREAYSSQLDQYAEVLRQLFHCEAEKRLFLLRSGKKLIL